LFVAIGGGVAVIGALLVWLAAAGALDDMWDQVVGGGIPVRRAAQEAQRTSGIAGTLSDLLDVPGGALYWTGIAGALVAFRRRELRVTAVGALAWILLVWGRVELQSYTFPHHYYIALPGIAVGIAAGIASLQLRDARTRLGVVVLVLTAPFVTYVAGPQVRQLEVPADQRWQLDAPIDWSLSYPVAQFIADHTRPRDRVLMTGSNPEVYWLAHRGAASRYFDWFIPLHDRGAARERLNDLESNPPAAIGVMDNPDAQEDLDSLRSFMDRHRYVVAYTVGNARVWLPAGAE
jgi:4-amino-4-deoxy-L-arabinose transferase-like glycosyltransferase